MQEAARCEEEPEEDHRTEPGDRWEPRRLDPLATGDPKRIDDGEAALEEEERVKDEEGRDRLRSDGGAEEDRFRDSQDETEEGNEAEQRGHEDQAPQPPAGSPLAEARHDEGEDRCPERRHRFLPLLACTERHTGMRRSTNPDGCAAPSGRLGPGRR
ncbi:MAG: hypothetical protein C4343_07055 [Chloroflexota bacterium]